MLDTTTRGTGPHRRPPWVWVRRSVRHGLRRLTRTRQTLRARLASSRRTARSLQGDVVVSAIVAVCYFFSARIGEALAFPSAPVSALWAPNAILLAAFLLIPIHRWWICLAAVLPLHLAAQLPTASFAQVAIQYIANCSLAVLGAIALVFFERRPWNFERLSAIVNLIAFGSILAPLLTSLAMAAAFVALGITDNFWMTAIVRTLTNTFAVLMLVPLIVRLAASAAARSLSLSIRMAAEAALLGASLFVVGLFVFVAQDSARDWSPALLYAPLPVLLWVTVRTGITGVCASILLLGAIATWGVLDGRGPFAYQNPVQNALSLVCFLVVLSMSLLLLAALLQERTEVARALSRSEAKFRSIFQSNLVPTVLWRCDGAIAEANAAFLQLVGRKRSDLKRHLIRWDELLRSDDGAVLAGIRSAIKSTGQFEPRRSELVLPDSRQLPVIIGGCMLPGESQRGVAYAFDLSATRRADAARDRMMVLHRAVLASLEDQIAVLDHAGAILQVNESWRQASEGLPASVARVLPGQNLFRAYNDAAARGDSTSAAMAEALEAVLNGAARRRRLEIFIRCGDEVRWFEQSVEALQRAEGGAVITRADVTARKRAELKVQEQQQQVTLLARAAVLGEFSGAIAHEISQPLTAILGNAEAALRSLDEDPKDLDAVRETLRDIMANDLRAGEVIRRLRSLLHNGELQLLPVDLNNVVLDALALARGDLARRQITVETHLAPVLDEAPGDGVQLQQIILNLIANASEAMSSVPGEERRLTLTTCNRSSDSAIEVTVRDHGGGVDTRNLERIFQPFFTTKPTGLGLGLAICRSIAKAHGGRLWAENAVPGTVFHFVLPTRRGAQRDRMYH